MRALRHTQLLEALLRIFVAYAPHILFTPRHSKRRRLAISPFGDICVPYGTRICSRPFFVYLSLTRHIYCSRLGIAKGDALPFPHLEIYACLTAPASVRGLCCRKHVCAAEASHICNSVFISPNSLNANKFALLSASSYIRLSSNLFFKILYAYR